MLIRNALYLKHLTFKAQKPSTWNLVSLSHIRKAISNQEMQLLELINADFAVSWLLYVCVIVLTLWKEHRQVLDFPNMCYF